MRIRFFGLLLSAALAAGAGFAWYVTRAPAIAQAPHAATAIPVVAATAEIRDVPIFLAGIGTVQAFNAVTVKARVDGELEKVAFAEGQMVKAGDVLAQLDPRLFVAQLAQAKAGKAKDEAQLANARLDLDRISELARRDFATRQSLDTQKALIAQLEAAVEADQAAIDLAQTQLSYTTIISPLDGRTGVRLVDQGNMVHASDPGGLVLITQVQPISVIFSLTQDNLADIRAAMAAGTLNVLALSRSDATELGQGTLDLIDNQIDTATGTLRLKARFPNLDNKLWPGEFVNIRLVLGQRQNAVTVPAQVVQRGPDGLYAYVIKADETVERRAVKAASIRDGIAVIDDGIAAGERVVSDGQYKLRPGVKVEVAPATPTAGAAKAGASPAPSPRS